MISQNHMISPIVSAIKQICEEKNIKEEEVVDAITTALAAAYRKDFGKPLQNVRIEFVPESGEMKAYDVKTVVADELKKKWEELRLKMEEQKKLETDSVPDKSVELGPMPGEAGEEDLKFNPKLHLSLTEAKALNAELEIGQELVTPLPIPSEFGRVAAQTAKQVIIQKLKEAERQSIFAEYKGKEGEVITGVLGRRERDAMLVDLGKTQALLPVQEQIPEERYVQGNRLKFIILEVSQTLRGPQIIVSRASPRLVRAVFTAEIPEIHNGLIEIKTIARDAGKRSKIVVMSKKETIDPVGSCIGQRGVRVQTVMAEIGGEKIDIIEWNEDPVALIGKALSPSRVGHIVLHQEDKSAEVFVPTDQLSLAIGRGGQNVRLASELTGWRLDLKEMVVEPAKPEVEPEGSVAPEDEKVIE